MKSVQKTKETKFKKKVVTIFLTLLVALFLSVSLDSFFVSAKEDHSVKQLNITTYKSIVLEPGDTLWDIAENKVENLNLDTEQVVELLMDINDLSGDFITAGQSLLIPVRL